MARRKDRRTRRSPTFGVTGVTPEVIPDDDYSVSDRVDGYSGAGSVRPPRMRTRYTEPLPISGSQMVCMYAMNNAIWTLADALERKLDRGLGPGRPSKATVIEVILWLCAANQFPSYRRVSRHMDDRQIWNILREAVANAWPDRPERRLPSKPMSRDQFNRLRKRLFTTIPDLDVLLSGLVTDIEIPIAVKIGCFVDDDSWTHPSKHNMIAGDATWIQSRFNRCSSKPTVDPITGEIHYDRCDPDAVSYRNNEQAPGNYLISAIARTEYPHERVILDALYTSQKGVDGRIFTDRALQLVKKVSHVRGFVYDMALHAAEIDRIQNSGLIAVAKVPRRKDGNFASHSLGAHNFRLGSSKFSETIVTNDGTPGINVVVNGHRQFVPLVRKQLKFRGSTLYGVWQVPDDPNVPRSQRCAKVLIRQSSTDEEARLDERRTRSLRAIPEGDPDFRKLFGLREDTESMHNDLKDRYWNRRARSVGHQRRTLDEIGYQLHQGITALIAWQIRTDGELGDHFGMWKPPDKPRRREAA